MENEFGRTYNKIGIAAGTLFTLMMISFFAFVYYDSTAPKDHSTANAPAEHAQVEEHATADDHEPAKEPADHAQTDDADHSSEKH